MPAVRICFWCAEFRKSTVFMKKNVFGEAKGLTAGKIDIILACD
jgi:hypothetical protein